MRTRGLLGLGILAVLALGFVRLSPPAESGKLDFGIWYWHSPFQVSRADLKELTEAGIGRIYVRAATLDFRQGELRRTLPQQWNSKAPGISTVLVFNFTLTLARAVDQASPEAISDLVRGEMDRAKAAGLSVDGIQFDSDCPTRLVPAYAGLIAEIRKRLPSGTEVSATALPTWLTSDGVKDLCHAVDFLVPQFYENRPIKSLKEIKPISDLAELKRSLDRVDRLPGTFRIGIPTYGHAMLFDENGKPSGMYRGLSLEDALRHPQLEFRGVVQKENEQIATFKGGAFTLAYTVPTLRLLKDHLKLIDKARPANCRGAILYRFPEPEETLPLSLRSIRAGLRGETEKCELSVRLEPGSRELSDREWRLRARQIGNEASFPARDGVRILLRLPDAGVEEVQPGEFDLVEVGLWDTESQSFVKCSRERANAIRFVASRVVPGKTLRSGAIVLASPSEEAMVDWAVKQADGRELVKRDQEMSLGLDGAKR